MAANIGIKVTEGVASGTSSLAEVSKRNIGVIGLFQRGVESKPIVVKSYSQFKRVFGDCVSAYYGPAFIKSIFDEAEDAEVVLNVSRAVPNDAQVATHSQSGIFAGYLGEKVKGEFGNHIAVKFSDGVLNVYYDADSTPTANSTIVESYKGTIAEIMQAVNRSSTYIVITDASTVTENSLINLSGGSDGTSSNWSLTSADLDVFKACDVQVITIADNMSLEKATLFNTWLNEQKKYVGLVTMPLPQTDSATAILTDANLWYTALKTNGISYIGVYNTWVNVYDDKYNVMLIPGTGAIIGAAYLRNSYNQGNGVHIPPGGTDGAFKHVLSVLPSQLPQDDINTIVQDYHVNVVVYDNNYGNFVISSRTMSDNELYMSIHIRLMTIYYMANLRQMSLPYIQKPNTPDLRKSLLCDLRNFFKAEYNSGALENGLSFEKACQLICDSDNNPPTQDRKLLNVDVNFVPTECTESISLRLMRNDGILKVEEA